MEELIDQIISSADFKTTSFFIRHLPFPLWRNFSGTAWNGIPKYIEKLCSKTKELVYDSCLDQNDIIHYIANSNENKSYFFVITCILTYGVPNKLTENEKYFIASGQKDLNENINEDILSCVITSYVLDTFKRDLDLRSIIHDEIFYYTVNDYKLTDIVLERIEFKQDGFVYDNKYYLYNVFLNRRPFKAADFIPALFKIISDQLGECAGSLFLRLDERLAMPLTAFQIVTHLGYDLFSGFSFDFDKTNLCRLKEHIVRYNPDTMDKLLWVIKQDFDFSINQPIWHIEIEELPFIPDNFTHDYILTSFINAFYYPSLHMFTHIDFTKNQYPKEIYIKKHKHSIQDGIPIDYYAEKDYHYKIWCLESNEISEEIWYKLVTVSLEEKSRILF